MASKKRFVQTRTFQDRLKACMRLGSLRVADLAWWFERRHSTVSGWIKDGRGPDGLARDIKRLDALLAKLEAAIKRNKNHFPLVNVTRAERKRRLQVARGGRKL